MKKFFLAFVLLNSVYLSVLFGQYKFDNILYGAAYYHEYMPHERLDKDIRLMKEAGVNVVRVGESTWALFEPQEGVFDFSWMGSYYRQDVPSQYKSYYRDSHLCHPCLDGAPLS